MVESNSNRFRSPSVFKTVQGPALITFHLFGAPSRIQTYGFTDLQSVALGHSATGALTMRCDL